MGERKDTIARNILYYRKKNGMSQTEIANRLGVSVAAVSKWETGSNSIDIENLFALCDIFGITISDMSTSHKDLDIDEPQRKKSFADKIRAVREKQSEKKVFEYELGFGGGLADNETVKEIERAIVNEKEDLCEQIRAARLSLSQIRQLSGFVTIMEDSM